MKIPPRAILGFIEDIQPDFTPEYLIHSVWVTPLVEQAVLVRHIFGNPFRPYSAPPFWPATVTALAEALHNGEDCHYALADALMEMGQMKLAEHFKQTWHPKGCWAMDVILGKE
jgi:hypothetical protein